MKLIALIVSRVGTTKIRAVEFFGQTLRLPADDDRGVGFMVQALDPKRSHATGNQQNPEYPAPAGTLGNEASADRADDWTEERTETPDGGCTSPVLDFEEIRDLTSTQRDASRATDSGKEPKDDQGSDVWRLGASDLPDDKEPVGDTEDNPTAVDFTQRRNEKGSKLEAHG